MYLESGGKRVFVATGGRPFDAALPAIIFLHGAGMDHSVWVLQTRYFAYRERAVLALDLPGHGRSDGPALDSIEALADWTAAIIASAGVERAALVGHSMGAAVAMTLAARKPELVERLVLLGAAPAMPVHPDLLKAAHDDPHHAFALITSWGHGRPAHLGGHPAPGLWMLGGGERLLALSKSGVLACDLEACSAWADGETMAARVEAPTLVVVGEEDQMTPPKAGRKLAGLIKDAELAPIAGAGHMMMIEKSDATLDALKAFL